MPAFRFLLFSVIHNTKNHRAEMSGNFFFFSEKKEWGGSLNVFENEVDFAATALTFQHTLQLSFTEKNKKANYFKWIEAIHTPDIFYFYNRSPYKSRHT